MPGNWCLIPHCYLLETYISPLLVIQCLTPMPVPDYRVFDNSAPTIVPQVSVRADYNLLPVPRNTMGITDREELTLVENVTSTVRAWELRIGDEYLPGNFDTAHLRDLHAYLMQDVYSEPGGTRQDERDIARSQAPAGPQLPAPADARLGANERIITLLGVDQVNALLDTLSTLLQQENMLKGLDKAQFVDRLAEYHVQYARAAPFTGGNERVLNVVLYELGQGAGYLVEPSKNPHLHEATDAILERGIDSDKSRLKAVLNDIVQEASGATAELRRRVTFRTLPIDLGAQLGNLTS